MDLRALVVALALAAANAGCLASLPIAPTVDSARISVEDRRTPEQKSSRRDSIASAVSFLGDENVEPPALLYFQEALQRHQARPERLDLIVEDFAIIDFFPVRLGSPNGGFLEVALRQSLMEASTDWSLIEQAGGTRDSDAVMCFFKGRINSRPVVAFTSAPYRLPTFAGGVRSCKEFQDALLQAIDRAAVSALNQLDQAAAQASSAR